MTALVWTLWDAVSALQWLTDHWWALLIGIVIMVFGPVLAPHKDSASGYRLQNMTVNQPYGHACNCVGPQPGESKCPCALVNEAALGRKMIAEGVTINGRHYRLVETTP